MGLLDQPIDKTAQAGQAVADHVIDHVERDAPALSGAIAQAVAQSFAAALSGVAQQFGDAVAELRKTVDAAPATIAATVSKVLDEANGLTLSTTIVITNTLTRRPQ